MDELNDNNFGKICRVCLLERSNMKSVFEENDELVNILKDLCCILVRILTL